VAARRAVTTIAELVVGDEPDRWSAAGFTVDAGVAQVGTVRLRLEPKVTGTRWALAGAPDEAVVDVDGLVTSHLEPTAARPAGWHPLGVTSIDHLVVMTPDLERTVSAIERGLGVPCRRVREAGNDVRQAFFRMGEVVLEVVTSPAVPDGAASFWGITFTVHDLDAAAALLGPDRASAPRPAVQQGRRILTVRQTVGLAVPVALMDPDSRVAR